MKYSELVNFSPIESTLQLIESNKTKDDEIRNVKTYIMSDDMADKLKATVIDQLQMDEVIDNKGVFIIGNYGTGKSHLMSVISAVAKDADNLQYIQNKKFAKNMEVVAGKFEVLPIEIGGTKMPLREVIFKYINEDFDKRGINFEIPNFDTVKSNKELIKNMLIAFNAKYPNKGYMIIVDEFLSYLATRNERDIVSDLEFIRALGEMCSKSKLRIILGIQEKLFDNPRFSFVSDTLKHIKDRFTQCIITKEATSYVVSERILKKTPEQKAIIRTHLEKFSNLYTGMASRLDEFVDLFPIHPTYIDVLNKVPVVETRHILKNISVVIKDIFDIDVPEDAPGIISYDSYWLSIKSDSMYCSDDTINRVVKASQKLEDIINTSFPKKQYKELAIQIIYALSVHRLTTNGLDVKSGLTAENFKDDLCLHLKMPEQEPDFLLGIVETTLREIMTTVSGQFIFFNENNNQYYIDVDKTVDYDEKIRQKAEILAADKLNSYFYDIVYKSLEWDNKKQYVTDFNIYQHDLNWDSHNIFREGYLFMGLPQERSTAQPERDFYIHFMPPYGNENDVRQDLNDEVYFYFKSTPKFDDMISRYSASCILAKISGGKDKDAYSNKSDIYRKKLVKDLNDMKNTSFDVVYKKVKKQLIEVLKGRYNSDLTFRDSIDLAASLLLDDYFNNLYPDYPIMKTKITRKNMADNVRAAFDYFSGKKTQQSIAMLQSFNILEDNKIRPEGSKYASYYIDKLKSLPTQGVLNYLDIFEERGDCFIDKKFKIWKTFTPIIFLSMVYSGNAVITLSNGQTITASSLDSVSRINQKELYEFKHLSKPAQMPLFELKKLYDVLDINPNLLNNPNDQEKGIEELLKKTQELCKDAVKYEHNLSNGFELWGEPLANANQIQMMISACKNVKDEFANYSSKFNTPAKLNNFSLTSEQIDKLGESIKLLDVINEYLIFKNNCLDVVSYISSIEFIKSIPELRSDIEKAKAEFHRIRDKIMDGCSGEKAAQIVSESLEKIKNNYIKIYLETHAKKRLDSNDAKRKGKILESKELSNLKRLSSIEILRSTKLKKIEQDLADIKVCYELTPDELKTNPFCRHCDFRLDDNNKNVYGYLDNIEERIDNLVNEWKSKLLEAVNDPICKNQEEYLTPQQSEVIDNFKSNEKLPEHVDEFFVNSIEGMLRTYETILIDGKDIISKLEDLPPLDEASFKSKVNDIISGYINGKNSNNLRIIVKKEDEGYN